MDSDAQMLSAERKERDPITGEAMIYIFRYDFESKEVIGHFYLSEAEFDQLIAQFRDKKTTGMRVIGQSKNSKSHE